MSTNVKRIIIAVAIGLAVGAGWFFGIETEGLVGLLEGFVGSAPEAAEPIAEGAAANLTQ